MACLAADVTVIGKEKQMNIGSRQKTLNVYDSDDNGSTTECLEKTDTDQDDFLTLQSCRGRKKQKIAVSTSPFYTTDVIAKPDKIASGKETEFDVWAQSLAMQLNNMNLGRALRLQLKIQSLLTEERIAHECSEQDSLNDVGGIGHDTQPAVESHNEFTRIRNISLKEVGFWSDHCVNSVLDDPVSAHYIPPPIISSSTNINLKADRVKSTWSDEEQ